jgi:hypothetical protein
MRLCASVGVRGHPAPRSVCIDRWTHSKRMCRHLLNLLFPCFVTEIAWLLLSINAHQPWWVAALLCVGILFLFYHTGVFFTDFCDQSWSAITPTRSRVTSFLVLCVFVFFVFRVIVLKTCWSVIGLLQALVVVPIACRTATAPCALI